MDQEVDNKNNPGEVAQASTVADDGSSAGTTIG